MICTPKITNLSGLAKHGWSFFTTLLGHTLGNSILAKWLGSFLSNRLLDSYKNRHETELENLKSKFASELEQTKNELEKAKLQFIRYSEKQFDLYNDLWKVLLLTKQQADMLWLQEEPSQVPGFSEQIRLTRNAIDNNLLLIEEEHYDKLIQLIEQFEQFQFGKLKLIDIRTNSQQTPITKLEAQSTIRKNKKTKETYDKLIMDIGKSFREQIKG